MSILDQLTLGEIEIAEKLGKTSITAFGDSNTPKAALMAAVVYVVRKREQPDYKFEDAKKLTMAEASAVIGTGEGDEETGVDPT